MNAGETRAFRRTPSQIAQPGAEGSGFSRYNLSSMSAQVFMEPLPGLGDEKGHREEEPSLRQEGKWQVLGEVTLLTLRPSVYTDRTTLGISPRLSSPLC